ncbi:MAG: response regulator [Sulfitobacter sp.]
MPHVSPNLTNLPTRPGKASALNVLILDDERFDRHRLARLCSGLEFPCIISNAKSLHEFSELLESDTFGLILLDYVLPDGTGLEALEMVRLSPRNLNTAMVMISGQEQNLVAQQAATMGCAAYLAKTDLTPDGFITAVQTALRTTSDTQLQAKPSYSAAEVEQLISLCTARCAKDVKPMVSRMMRQLRDIRTRKEADHSHVLGAIEQNCMSLWAFLVETEREDGAVLLSELIHAESPLGKTDMDVRPLRRPPSPFSRRPH